MDKILLATGNLNKIREINSALESSNINIKIISPKALNLDNIDPVENSNTLEGNAEIKAKEFYSASNITSLADDTGLEVDSLDGKPGVKSARYAGENATSQDNRSLLLKSLKDKKNRNAKFRTIFCLLHQNQKYFFEGICNGVISEVERGDSGFGYDSIFIPDGYKETFAEMDPDIKNQISHRGLAVKKLVRWLSENN